MDRISELEATVRDLQDQLDGHQLVLAWILAKFPDEDVFKFLSRQANELDGSPKFRATVDQLDELREDVASLHALRALSPESPR